MDISKLNFKSATNVSYMFYNSSSLGGTLSINALNLTNDYDMFSATSHQSSVQVNNETLLDTLISEKTAQTNLVKGELISKKMIIFIIFLVGSKIIKLMI